MNRGPRNLFTGIDTAIQWMVATTIIIQSKLMLLLSYQSTVVTSLSRHHRTHKDRNCSGIYSSAYKKYTLNFLTLPMGFEARKFFTMARLLILRDHTAFLSILDQLKSRPHPPRAGTPISARTCRVDEEMKHKSAWAEYAVIVAF